MHIDYKKELDAMRRNFVHGHRKIGVLPRPFWMTSYESLSRVYQDKDALAQCGEIHYAYLVQANIILFKSFPPFNCPADIVFSTDEYYDKNPLELGKIASKLYSYKDMSTAPENIRVIANAITDEYTRLYNWKLPLDADKTEADVLFTTLMIFRKHLPERRLLGSLFPVLTMPYELQSTLILPKQYWTNAFAEFIS